MQGDLIPRSHFFIKQAKVRAQLCLILNLYPSPVRPFSQRGAVTFSIALVSMVFRAERKKSCYQQKKKREKVKKRLCILKVSTFIKKNFLIVLCFYYRENRYHFRIAVTSRDEEKEKQWEQRSRWWRPLILTLCFYKDIEKAAASLFI